MNLLTSTFGQINAPKELNNFGSVESGGISNLLNLFFQILIVGAGIYALVNFILAGYGFISAGSDPKKVQAASSKIVQTIIGLVIVAGAFVIAALIGIFFFDSASAILKPTIVGPK